MSNNINFKPLADGLSTDPIPHSIIENYADSSFMAEVLRELEVFEAEVRVPQKEMSNPCYDPTVDPRLAQYPATMALFEHLGSEAFFAEMTALMSPFVDGRLAIPTEEIEEIGRDPKRRDNLVKLSGPGEPYQVRRNHRDNPRGIYNFLFYARLPGDYSTGGNLLFHLYEGKAPGWKAALRRKLTGVEMRLVKSVEYKANTMVVFLNGWDSFHEVSMRKNAKVSRIVFSGGLSADRPLF